MISWSFFLFLFLYCNFSWQLGPISSFMVNSYCGSLDDFFSELVFYELLKTEDAQCFSIKSSIEEGFFILAIGSIILALVNGIVRKATIQYFRDQVEVNGLTQIQNHKTDVECDAAGQEGKDRSLESAIDAPPILFTDAFRWLLKQNIEEKLVKDGQATPSEDRMKDLNTQSSHTDDF